MNNQAATGVVARVESSRLPPGSPKPRVKYADAFSLPDFDSWGYAEWGVKKLSLDGEIGVYEGDCLTGVWIRFGRDLAFIDKEKARGHLKVAE